MCEHIAADILFCALRQRLKRDPDDIVHAVIVPVMQRCSQFVPGNERVSHVSLLPVAASLVCFGAGEGCGKLGYGH